MIRFMYDRAKERGEISDGMALIEATSGNTGIALSYLARLEGHPMYAVIPENMSQERKDIIRGNGGHVIDAAPDDFLGAVKKRDEMVQEMKGWSPRQFENPDNIDGHYMMIGKEILEEIPCPIDAFVSGVGTGGTLMGVTKRLKEKYPNCKCIAMEPTECPILAGGAPGSHDIQGIADMFVPPIVDMKLIDEIIHISSEEAIQNTKRLIHQYGLLVGISSGANMLAAERLVEKYNYKCIVTLMPDRAERYMSMGIMDT